MNRLYTVEGHPQTLTNCNISIENLLSQTCSENEQPNSEKPISAFVVEIMITKINKYLHFPLISYKEKGIRIYNDRCELPFKTTVDNFMLEYLVKYQQIEGIVLRGYIWTENKSFEIRNVIKNLFDLRTRYKQEKNPLEMIFKLLMNSAYGKTIQNVITKRNIYFR